jgi:CRP/FNR family nitrogen fixation transcriptional regulator
VIAYRRSRLASLIHDDAALLGRKTAQEKIATFLPDMAERLSKDDTSSIISTSPSRRCRVC